MSILQNKNSDVYQNATFAHRIKTYNYCEKAYQCRVWISRSSSASPSIGIQPCTTCMHTWSVFLASDCQENHQTLPSNFHPAVLFPSYCSWRLEDLPRVYSHEMVWHLSQCRYNLENVLHSVTVENSQKTYHQKTYFRY